MLNNLDFSYFLKKNNLIYNFYKNNIIILKTLEIKKKFIIFDGNLKSECSIRINEFTINNKGGVEIKEGDYIEAFIINIENFNSNIILSRLKLKKFFFWKNIYKLYKKKVFIKCKFINKIKGGYLVFLKNNKCFLPFSCSDKKLLNYNYYIGKDLYFLIFNVDIIKKNIILSRKFLIYLIIKIKKKLFFKNVKPGFLIKGIIKSISKYFIFIDIGYLDCVVFYKDFLWGNHKYFNEIINIGKSILSIVLKIDKIKLRVFLGVKQLFNYWKYLLKIKDKIKYCRILRVNNKNTYVILSKYLISIINNFNTNLLNKLKINSYKKIFIKKYNFKKKELFLILNRL